VYKKKFDISLKDVTGDIFEDRKKTMTLLQGNSLNEINHAGIGRSGDFKNEVQWRLLLRNDEVNLSTFHGDRR
jgi:hypothetical protein